MRADAVLRRAVGVKGNIARIVFTEGSKTFECFVPDDSLWIAVKDNLILSEYERCGVRLCELKGTVVDAGAHVGLFSLRAARHAARVIAIEPHPLTLHLLKLNLRQNAINNVTVMERALWGSPKPVTLVDGAHSAANSVIAGQSNGEEVKTVTLEEILRGAGPIDLLKLDVEGAEFGVIESARPATLAKVNAIVGELHPEGKKERVSEIADKLRSVGFSVAIVDPPVEFWRDSVSRLLANSGRLRGNRRLKALVLAAYSFAAIERRLLRESRSTGSDLAFLFARRGPN